MTTPPDVDTTVPSGAGNSLGARVLLGLIVAYRYAVSPMIGRHCRFFPSCSEYAGQVIKSRGAYVGSYLTLRRLCRCHPWHPGGYDPAP